MHWYSGNTVSNGLTSGYNYQVEEGWGIPYWAAERVATWRWLGGNHWKNQAWQDYYSAQSDNVAEWWWPQQAVGSATFRVFSADFTDPDVYFTGSITSTDATWRTYSGQTLSTRTSDKINTGLTNKY